MLVLILVIAGVLRFWHLNSLPPGLNHDEGVNALDVEHIIAGWRPIFLPANNGREALFMYTQALVGAFLGVTPTTLRLTAALWGVLTVGLTFGLARRWYGDHLGLLRRQRVGLTGQRILPRPRGEDIAGVQEVLGDANRLIERERLAMIRKG